MLIEINIINRALCGRCGSECKSEGLLNPPAVFGIGTDLVRPRERSAGMRGIGGTRNAEVA
jgi:hypothetical protein